MEQNQNQEQSQIKNKKKEYSYRYWVDNDPLFKNAEKQDYKPVEIDDIEKIKEIQKEEENRQQNNQASVWNQAQIWEERKMKTEDIEQYLKNKVNKKGLFTKGLDFELIEIKSVSGQSNVVCVRGQQKLGYELDVKIQIQGVGNNIDQEAILQIQISDDGDREISDIQNDESNFKNLIKKNHYQIGDILSDILKNIFKQ